MAKRKTWLKVSVPLFEAGYIELHTDPKKLAKRSGESGWSDDCAGCTVNRLQSQGTVYVYVGDGKLSTLAHECFHAAVRYLSWIGVPLYPDEGNETHAYLIEYLIKKFEGVVRRGK